MGCGLLVLLQAGMSCPGLHGLQSQPCVLIVFTRHKMALLMCLTFTCNMFCKECLSSIDDEECSKMHYALWIAEFREPIDVWMLLAPLGYAWRFAWFNTNTLPSVRMLFSIAVRCQGLMCVALGLCAWGCGVTWTWLIWADLFHPSLVATAYRSPVGDILNFDYTFGMKWST